MAGIQLDPFKILWLQRLFVFKFPAYQGRKTWAFSNFVFKTMELRGCLYQSWISIKSPVPSDNTSLNRRFSFQDRAPCASSIVCAGMMLQAIAGWEAFFSRIFPIECPRHYLGNFFMRCFTIICLLLLESLLRSKCSVWILFWGWSTWRFLKFASLLTSRPSRSWRKWHWHLPCA